MTRPQVAAPRGGIGGVLQAARGWAPGDLPRVRRRRRTAHPLPVRRPAGHRVRALRRDTAGRTRRCRPSPRISCSTFRRAMKWDCGEVVEATGRHDRPPATRTPEARTRRRQGRCHADRTEVRNAAGQPKRGAPELAASASQSRRSNAPPAPRGGAGSEAVAEVRPEFGHELLGPRRGGLELAAEEPEDGRFLVEAQAAYQLPVLVEPVEPVGGVLHL